jgi:hypothetical protein
MGNYLDVETHTHCRAFMANRNSALLQVHKRDRKNPNTILSVRCRA